MSQAEESQMERTLPRSVQGSLFMASMKHLKIYSLKTKNLIFLLSICLFGFFGFTSCHKSEAPIEIFPPNTQASEYFPNKVGDKWIYDVYDSVTQKMDTVSVEVIGITTLPKGETAKVWIFDYPDKVDTSFVFQSGDTVKIVPALDLNPNDYVVKETYIIPLSVGNSWTNLFLYDSLHVTKETQISVNNLHFDSTYFLIEKGQTFNYFIYTEEYFKPTIGMVQLSRYEYNFFIPENKVWYLKHYYLQ